MFRKLRADEIDCRVSTVKQNGCSILLYKDARVDMNILDETFGTFGWQRKHEIIDGRLYCTVSVFDKNMDQWVSKQDVGTESYTEKEKGQASDSFKRACFNWGIGRELYTAPFIWIPIEKTNIQAKQRGEGFNVYDSFSASEIAYDESGRINVLVIKNKKGDVVFSYGKRTASKPKEEPARKEPDVNAELITVKDAAVLEKMLKPKAKASVLKQYGVEKLSDLTKVQYVETIEAIKKLEAQKQKAEELKEKVDALNGNESTDQ